MMRYLLTASMLLFGMMVISRIALAEDLLMLRSTEPFPETMSVLQEAIRKQGYTVSRVQRVDIGLSKAGYNTDKYRIVFFGKDDEIQGLLKTNPELAPYLPLKIVIYAEHGDTILVGLDPNQYNTMFPAVKKKYIFSHWEQDINNIFNDVRAKTQN